MLFSCIQRNPEIISALAAGTLESSCLHIVSIAAGLSFRSAGLFESSVRYSAKAKYRPNEIPLGDFNFKIKHENSDIMN